MASIVTIQRWFRTLLQRRQFLRITWATETLQVLIFVFIFLNCNCNVFIILLKSWWRMILAQRLVNRMRMNESAAVYIQSAWRKHRVSSWYKNLRQSVITLQAHSRGYLARQNFTKLKNTVIIIMKILKLNNIIINYNYFQRKSISAPQISNSKESSQEELHDSE